MKKLLSVVTLCLVLASSAVYASFPVKNDKANSSETVQTQSVLEENVVVDLESKKVQRLVKKASKKINKQNGKRGGDDKLIMVLLWVALGGLAAHRWYAKKPVGWNILFILTAGGCLVWAIIDLINILRDNF